MITTNPGENFLLVKNFSHVHWGCLLKVSCHNILPKVLQAITTYTFPKRIIGSAHIQTTQISKRYMS